MADAPGDEMQDQPAAAVGSSDWAAADGPETAAGAEEAGGPQEEEPVSGASTVWDIVAS